MKEPMSMLFAADVGGGRSLDVEFGVESPPWIVLGGGIRRADIWLEQLGNLERLRVQILRSDSGIEMRVDRGDGPEKWWPPGAAPRLAVSFDAQRNRAVALARVGEASDFQEVVLGEVEV